MRYWMIVLLLLTAAPRLAANEHDHITIDLKRQWQPMDFSPTGVKAGARGSMNLSGEYPKFSSTEPGTRATFQYAFHLPIEMTQYPMLKLKYRARNIDTNNTLTCIWINEGKGAAVFPLIDFDKLTVDGQIHEIEVDLPKAPTGSSGTPFESGPVNGVLVSVMSEKKGEGSIELIDLTFAATDRAPQPRLEDAPIRVRVLDPESHPIAGASAVVDAERKDVSQTATADASGEATFRPVKNELDQHTVEVAAPGMVSIIDTIDAAQPDVVEITLPKGMQVGGFVQDEDGKPIAGATVSVFVEAPALHLEPSYQALVHADLHTDDKGQWISPALPQTDRVYLQVTHPDHVSDRMYTLRSDIIDELRSGIATIVLKR